MMSEAAGVPTLGLEARFLAPSRLGDILDFGLEIKKIGGTSVSSLLTCGCGREMRMTVAMTLVWVATGGRPAPWPESIRAPMQAFMEAE
jgi:4-hydroxybenzoyl-CoA thioesterase